MAGWTPERRVLFPETVDYLRISLKQQLGDLGFEAFFSGALPHHHRTGVSGTIIRTSAPIDQWRS